MGKTTIEWTDASWNPVVGCTEVSPGCANCYAARLAATRLKNLGDYAGLSHRLLEGGGQGVGNGPPPQYTGPIRWTGEVRFLGERLEEPLHWRKPRRIFVCDMGDLFHESVYPEQIVEIFGIMARCPQHTFQVLTKRARRMQEIVTEMVRIVREVKPNAAPFLPNVWLGVSVENQYFADERIPLLLQTPAAVRFISAEPLLGQVDLRFLQPNREVEIDSLKGTHGVYRPHGGENAKLDWVICGGESGANARAMHPDWARSLRDQCIAAGVPFFFKQWGEFSYDDSKWFRKVRFTRISVPFQTKEKGLIAYRVGKKKAGRLLDGREWSEFPCQK